MFFAFQFSYLKEVHASGLGVLLRILLSDCCQVLVFGCEWAWTGVFEGHRMFSGWRGGHEKGKGEKLRMKRAVA